MVFVFNVVIQCLYCNVQIRKEVFNQTIDTYDDCKKEYMNAAQNLGLTKCCMCDKNNSLIELADGCFFCEEDIKNLKLRNKRYLCPLHNEKLDENQIKRIKNIPQDVPEVEENSNYRLKKNLRR